MLLGRVLASIVGVGLVDGWYRSTVVWCQVVGGGVFKFWLVPWGCQGWSSDIPRLVAVLNCLVLCFIEDMAIGLDGLPMENRAIIRLDYT